MRWFDSDGGRAEVPHRAARATEFPNGCFRGAVALPSQTRAEDVVALRLRAFTRAPGKDEARLPPGSGRARLELVNSLFFLGPDDRPAPSLFQWRGSVDMAPEGAPHELKIRD